VNLEDFGYELPVERIAQEPAPERTEAKLMVLDRSTGATEHRIVADLPTLLRPGDLLVLNDTKVVPARLHARKPSGGRVEILLLRREGPEHEGAPSWRCLLDASRPPGPGTRLDAGEGLSIEVVERGSADWVVRLHDAAGDVRGWISRNAEMPLPPYIRRTAADARLLSDRERYQTVYAKREGAVAAPTAGLHFSQTLLNAIVNAGIELAYVTLHVGAGTFQPVRVARVEDHRMHEEAFDLPAPTAHAIEETRRRRGRVVAVGTTVLRTLESQATEDGTVHSGTGWCDLFIYPGYRFRVVDALLTNFHLPRSTLLMLVCAFAGLDRVKAAYAEAIRSGYRFYSYGDAMLVRPA
jgi:S-adenosylmethionine:tRNA ribosyltransferase-isomerase